MKLSERLANLPVTRMYQGKQVISFGPWRPDMAPFANPGLITAQNVMPYMGSYKPFPSLSIATDALAGTCMGAFSGTDDSGNTYTYAGDDVALYVLTNNAWVDVTNTGGAYSLGSDSNWRFTRFNNKAIAVAIEEDIQAITFGGSNFADLATSTLMPKAKYVDTMLGRFVVIANTNEGSAHPRRVRWCAVDDETDWDASSTTLAGFRDMRGRAGEIRGFVGGKDYGVILQENAITRMQFAGSPIIFQFDEVETNKGAAVPNSVIPLGRFVFYLDDEGWMLFDGNQSTPIGKGKIDQEFYDEFDSSYDYRMSAGIFFRHSLVCWAYPTSDSAGGGDPDKMLVYHWPTGEWAKIDLDLEYIFSGSATGYTLETLDSVSASLDDLAFSLDSPVWVGGDPLFNGFDRTHSMGHFLGSAMAATLETGERQLNQGMVSTIKSIRPIGDALSSDSTIEIGKRATHEDTNSYLDTVTVDSNGRTTHRHQLTRSRYHRFRYKGTFDHVQGLEIEGAQSSATH